MIYFCQENWCIKFCVLKQKFGNFISHRAGESLRYFLTLQLKYRFTCEKIGYKIFGLVNTNLIHSCSFQNLFYELFL